MTPSAAMISAAHAALSPVDELLAERRTLYGALADVTAQQDVLPTSTHRILDDPMVRGHLGALFTGGQPIIDGAAPRPEDVIATGFGVEVGGHPVRVASTSAAARHVAPALARVHEVLDRQGTGIAASAVLTVERGDRLSVAYALLVDGVGLGLAVAPEMVGDLLPHIGLFVLTDRAVSGRLGSASAREFPGLVMLPEPLSALEALEAVVHEGAHQKFFDLAMTRSMLEGRHWEADGFTPSWAPARSPEWPLEQSFAAWHAYTCMAALTASGVVPGAGSLLPHAAERAAEIGAWLLRNGRFLGPDGHRLLGSLMGRAPAESAPRADGPRSTPLGTYRCGRRALVLCAGSPPDLYWVPADQLV